MFVLPRISKIERRGRLDVLPCFQLFYCGNYQIIILFHLSLIQNYSIGACFGFAGLAFTDRPHLDLLGPIIPLFYQRHDIALRETTALFFGAFKNAICALHQHYANELPAPYQSSYMPL